MHGQPVRPRPRRPGPPRHAPQHGRGRGGAGRRRGATGRRGATTAPIFVDVTGRRRRIVRHAVIIAGLMVTAYLGVVGVGLLAGSSAPLTPWPGRAQHGHDADAGSPWPTSGTTSGTPPARATEPSPRPGTVRPATTPGATTTTAATPQPTATFGHPGNSHATPRGFGRTRAPNSKKS